MYSSYSKPGLIKTTAMRCILMSALFLKVFSIVSTVICDNCCRRISRIFWALQEGGTLERSFGSRLWLADFLVGAVPSFHVLVVLVTFLLSNGHAFRYLCTHGRGKSHLKSLTQTAKLCVGCYATPRPHLGCSIIDILLSADNWTLGWKCIIARSVSAMDNMAMDWSLCFKANWQYEIRYGSTIGHTSLNGRFVCWVKRWRRCELYMRTHIKPHLNFDCFNLEYIITCQAFSAQFRHACKESNRYEINNSRLMVTSSSSASARLMQRDEK